MYHYRFVWPRDLCYVRYWRRNDDGSYGKCLGISPSFPLHLVCLSMIELVFTHVIVQLCYFILGSTKIVVRNRDLCGLILRVTSAELY